MALSALQRVGIKVCRKLFTIAIGDGDVLLAKDYLTTFKHFYFVDINDVRAVYSEKLRLRKSAFYAVHRAKAEYSLGAFFGVDLHVVFKTFNVDNVVEVDANKFVIALHKHIATIGR